MKKLCLLFCFALINTCLYAQSTDTIKEIAISTSTLIQNTTEPLITVVEASTGILRIVHPYEGMRMPAVDSSFVYGYARPEGKLTINGKETPIHPQGGFLAMTDYSPGNFTIKAELRIGTTIYTVKRSIIIACGSVAVSTKTLFINNIEPSADMEVLAPEALTVSCSATPEKEVYFRIAGIKKKYRMTGNSAGFYQGTCIIRQEIELKNTRIIITITDKATGKSLSAKSGGTIRTMDLDTLQIVEVTTNTAILRAGPSTNYGDKAAYMLFPPIGTRLRVVGRRGNELKIKAAERMVLYISKFEVKPLPEGTAYKTAMVGSPSVRENDRSVLVKIPLSMKIPVEVVPYVNENHIDIILFGAYSNTDWIFQNKSTRAIVNMQWYQDETDIYRFRLNTRADSWWGYDIRYEGSTLVFELRSPPEISSGNPFKDILIALDAGHSKDTGAAGITGTYEKDINLSIAYILKDKLLNEGAQVFMVRKGEEDLSLYERPKLAWKERADILLSIHNNATGEGQNPYEYGGFSIYYFNQHSFILADEIHKAYMEVFSPQKNPDTALKDNNLDYSSFVLTRPAQFPAVLIESAYMTIPREEALLRTREFQEMCAQAMFTGLKRYLTNIRNKNRKN